MIDLRSVEQVRAAEEAAFRLVPDGTLMQRAAHALAISCARLLAEVRGAVVGARVVLLVGSGNNGGDALWSGAFLARRGCRVDAILLSDRAHAGGLAALRAAGGWVHDARTDDDDDEGLIDAADLVIDGILGIGGRGGLRSDAAALADAVATSDALIVAVDVPSGVDADTGAAAGGVVSADVTVTFGAVKPGLVIAPGSYHAGVVQFVDIGLDFGQEASVAQVMDALDVAAWVPEPIGADYKYSRGVVGLAVGSAAYRGAALMATQAARHANVGMVRLLDRRDGVAPLVVEHFPDVVIDGAAPVEQSRATAWACGSGFTGDADDEAAVMAVLAAEVPVVLDAGALTVVADSAAVRARIEERHRSGLVTVLTPHQGEFERLQPGLLAASSGRLAAAASAAANLHCLIVLKGAGTIIAAPTGEAFVDTEGTADLGVAGSGDVLTGIIGAILASAEADGRCTDGLEPVAAAVWLHGRAGQLAARQAPVAAPDIAAQTAAAVRSARFGTSS